ncbi:MAG: Asp23/Gls24 family envelope stress response protein [Lachnospiraceae bacterium]|nr:Asp23/Gls24 family envelope stress response protein [Lachnospiraceae bacterium]
MEKETTRNTYVLKEDEAIGSVKIADDVVAMIAGLAATEVEGVSTVVGNNSTDTTKAVKKMTKGVKVLVTGKNVKIDLAINMDYGYNIPATCEKVQQKVKSTVENMTGLEVSDVNIRIAAISMKKEN